MIPEIIPVKNYSGNGTTTKFDFDFYIENENQLVVYHTDKDGQQTELEFGKDYTINEVGQENGSYITFPIVGSSYDILQGESSYGVGDAEKISICLHLPISQETEYGTSDKLDQKSLEYSLDYLTRLIQILNRQMERSVKVPEGAGQTADDLIRVLEQAQIMASESANKAATSASQSEQYATNALTSANNAEESYNKTVAKETEFLQEAETKKNEITNLSNTQKSDITSLGANVKNNIQSLGIFMQDDRLFYYDANGVKHEFRNDFGGIAPMPIKHKEIKKVSNGYALTWTDPDDSVYKENLYCKWDNTLIIAKEGSYPASPFDGITVVKSTVRNAYQSNAYVFECDTTKDYKFRAFPCSTNRVYNLQDENKFGQWIYSFTRIMNETIPSEKIEYRGVNEHYECAYNDFDAGNKVKLRDWESSPFLLKDRLAPCAVSFAGELKYFLDVNDFTKKEDGTNSNNADSSTDLNFFMRVKLLYRRKRKNANGDTEVDISNEKVNDEYKPYGGFVKPDGALREYIYLPIYRGSLINGKVRSIAGQTVMSGQTAPNERAYCQANGVNHDMITEADGELIEDLFLLMFKTTDSQSALGQGKSNGGDNVGACVKTGTMDKKGLFGGSKSTAEDVKFLGMETRWGSQWERRLGEVYVNGVRKVKKCQGTSDGSTVEDFNFTGEGYNTLSELPTITGSSGGYISKEQTVDDIGTYPVVISGSSTTNECDGGWFNNSGTMVVLRGGSSSCGAFCGLFAFDLSAPASAASWYIGSSVSYKPL